MTHDKCKQVFKSESLDIVDLLEDDQRPCFSYKKRYISKADIFVKQQQNLHFASWIMIFFNFKTLYSLASKTQDKVWWHIYQGMSIPWIWDINLRYSSRISHKISAGCSETIMKVHRSSLCKCAWRTVI